MTVAEFKAQFSTVLKTVETGEKVAITYGKAKIIKAMLVPTVQKPTKRKLGILKGKATFKIGKNYKITNEEFLGL